MHLVEQLDGVAEVKMICPIDDLESRIESESFAEWSDTGFEIDEDIVASSEHEADRLLAERKLSGSEGLASDEGFRCGREATYGSDPGFQGGNLERGPASERVAEYPESSGIERG